MWAVSNRTGSEHYVGITYETVEARTVGNKFWPNPAPMIFANNSGSIMEEIPD